MQTSWMHKTNARERIRVKETNEQFLFDCLLHMFRQNVRINDEEEQILSDRSSVRAIGVCDLSMCRGRGSAHTSEPQNVARVIKFILK